MLTSDTTKTTYTGNGAAEEFDYNFRVDADSELKAVRTTIASGEEVDLTLNVDYSVDRNSNDVGGTVTFPMAGSTYSTLASTHKITLVREVPYTQDLDLWVGGGVPEDEAENALDRIVMQVQQLVEQIARCVKTGIASGVDPDDLIDSLIAAAAAAVAAQAAAESAQGDAEDAKDTAVAAAAAAAASAGKATALPDTLVALSFVRINASGEAYETLTPAGVLAAIGAAASGHTHPGVYEPVDTDILRADTTDGLETGYTVETEYDYGGGSPVSSGTVTVDNTKVAHAYYTNGGAHTLAPDNVSGAQVIHVTNNASAGTITTSGWDAVLGDDLDTTDGNEFELYCRYINGKSSLVVLALQ